MKKVIFILSFFLIPFFAMKCQTKINENSYNKNPERLKRVWMLIEFQGFDREDLIKKDAQINLTDFKNGNAKMGCNSIGFAIKATKLSIKTSNLITTKMHCGENMKLETAFLKIFSTMNRFKIETHRLTLSNSKKQKMVFVAQDWD